MIDPNVLNYFLVILGGFGVVWSYRHSSKERKQIGEFEYAAFSAIWGIPVFFVFLEAIKSKPEMVKSMFDVPMVATPTLFLLGLLFGHVGARIVTLICLLREYFLSKFNTRSVINQ